ncbi:MAG: sugar transferase [Propionibacteriaceae bacterium]|nr:sugar transferase [Propionibacteriaceae bacterium]
MPKSKRSSSFALPTAALVVADALVITLSTVTAVLIRDRAGWLPVDKTSVSPLLVPIAAVVVPTWLAMLGMWGAYQRRVLGSGPDEFRRVLNASLMVGAALGVGCYLIRFDLSRSFYVLLFALGIPLLLLDRWIARRLLHRALRVGRYNTEVLIAGDESHITDVVKALRRNRWLGYRAVGLLMRQPPPDGTLLGLPVVGRPGDSVEMIKRSDAQGVIFAEGSFSRGHDFNRIAAALEDVDAQTIVVPALADVSAGRMHVRPVAGMPLVHVERPTASRATRGGKRAFDILGASAALLLTWPILLGVAIAIKLDDGGPVIFRQQRVGRGGKTFNCLKFRSMVVNAEELKAQLMEQNESDGALFKMEKDPRITRVGHFIRRYSLDEFPQFINVLKGDMSVVGPRPALPSEVQTYKSHVLRRLDVRPGITGLWQVSGRSDLDWDETVRLDLFYVDNWSMLQDLVISLRTVKVLITGSGAY